MSNAKLVIEISKDENGVIENISFDTACSTTDLLVSAMMCLETASKRYAENNNGNTLTHLVSELINKTNAYFTASVKADLILQKMAEKAKAEQEKEGESKDENTETAN